MNSKENNICALVVTYNRKNLLIECLNSLLKQSYPLDAILIVDNASTDGTPEFLMANGFIDEIPRISDGPIELKKILKKNNSLIEIFYIRMQKNTGGAGGFYEAIKRGYMKGYNWLWVMDDDAEPYENTLENLINSPSAFLTTTVALAPVEIGTNGQVQKIHRGWFNEKLYKTCVLKNEDYKKKECRIGFSSFVGLLIKSNIISKVGLPNNKFFIWYDDVEYCIRLLKEGNIMLVKNSIILHKDKSTIRKKSILVTTTSEYWKVYYGVRNRTYILKTHFNKSLWKTLIFVLLKGSFKIILFEDKKWLKTKIIFKAWLDGTRGNLGKTIDPYNWKKFNC
ncbi:MAG: glycosyltransferase family 2 protein [Candidatus Helarchaeota archaeon]